MLVLYSDKTTSFSTLGIGVLRDFISDPLITEELNGAYTLEFSYSKTGYLVDNIVEGAIIKANNQPFRIWSVKKDMGKVEVLAKHIFFDLSTNFLEDVAPTKLKAQEALDWIIKRAQTETLFKVSGDCSIIASSRYVRKNITDAIYNEDNAILKRFGGELELDGYNVIVHAKRGKNANFSIRYKKNLTGIEFNLDFSTVATRIMPQGANELLLDQKYVDSPLIENYFTPIYKKVEFSNIGVDEDTSEEEAKKLLLEQAQQLFNAGIDKPEISIKVDFVELSKCVEYKDYSNLESCNLGDTIKAIIPELNINLETRIVKTVYNCSLNRFTTLELGTVKPDFVSNQSKVVNEINNAVSQVNPESILSKAKEEATNIINHPFSGNIYIDKNTGVLYLMDTNDISTSKNIWRWSLGGLGFSKNGVNGPYETAITQDGSIVADFITTGKINTSLIEGYEQLILSVSKTEKKVEELEKTVDLFVPVLEPDLVLIPTFENGLPKISTEYFVKFSAKFEGEDVTPIVTCQSENEGITLSITDKLTFSVNSSVAIPNKDNKYELLFTYTKEEKVYSKTMIIYLMRVNENEDLTERLDQIVKDLNNNYPNNDELNEALENQKSTIIEETSTMIQQSASEVTTSIINKVNTDGVTTLKNTLVTIDINGINVAKNDEDVVSLLDNKGLYVSDGKLKEEESNLLMKTDRNGAYFKSAIIDGVIKEQGLFQKEIIEDTDFGKGQAGFWIGG